MIDNSRRTGPAVEGHRHFLAWLTPTIALRESADGTSRRT